MNKAGRALIAQGLHTALPTVNVKFGKGTVAPGDDDTGLSGAEITNVNATVNVSEATNAFTTTVTFTQDTVLNEIGLFTGNGAMFDRFLLGGQSIISGGKIQLEWELEVK